MKTIRLSSTNRKQRGFSSVELGLTLLVVAVLIAGAVILYTRNLRQTSIQANVQALQTMAGQAKASYGQNNQYANVTTAVAVQGHIVPDNLRDGTAATASNPYGAAITVGPANGTGTNDLLTWNWSNVPAKECSDIVTGSSTSFRRISIGGTDVQPLDGALDIATLTTQCESNTSTGNVDITFYVGRS